MDFLPPSPQQINDLSSLITLIKSASDKDVQAVVAKMKENVDASQKAQAAAADDVVKAQKEREKAEKFVASVTKLKEQLDQREADLNRSNQACDDRQQTLVEDRKEFEDYKAAQLKALAEREAAVNEREQTISQREKEAAAIAEKAQETLETYEKRMADLQSIVSGGYEMIEIVNGIIQSVKKPTSIFMGVDLLAPKFVYDVQCLGPDDDCREDYLRILSLAKACREAGRIRDAERLEREAQGMVKERWREVSENLVTNVGRNDVLDKYFKGSTYTAAWYLGLKGTGSAAAADTLASHAGWSEVTPYSGNRPAITFGTTASQSNTATAVSYSITGSATVAGAFIASVNTGTSGILYSATDFAASRTVANGDTLNVTPTVTS